MEQSFEKIEKGIEGSGERPASAEAEMGEGRILEKEKLSREEKEPRKELEKELQKIKLSSQEQVQVQKEAEDLKKQTAEGKIKRLLDLAQSKGLAYSVEVVKKMDDAYLLDVFHDTLAKGGLFKKFLGK